MKIRLLALPLGLALLLSACLPDLPAPEGQVEVTVTPAEAAALEMDWTITGAAAFRPDVEVVHEGTCAPGCAQFDVTVQRGTWEFRMSPPPFNDADLDLGWVGTGYVDEITADYVEEFSLGQQQTREIEASFRRPNILEWDYTTSAAGEPATVTLTGVTSGRGEEFQLAGVQVTCQALGDSFMFELAEPVTVSSTSRNLELAYDGELGTPTFRGDRVSCRIDLAWDSDNRPVGTV